MHGLIRKEQKGKRTTRQKRKEGKEKERKRKEKGIGEQRFPVDSSFSDVDDLELSCLDVVDQAMNFDELRNEGMLPQSLNVLTHAVLQVFDWKEVDESAFNRSR